MIVVHKSEVRTTEVYQIKSQKNALLRNISQERLQTKIKIENNNMNNIELS